MSSNDTPTVLVTGARGTSGRRILDRLVAVGVPVRSSAVDRVGAR